MKDITIKKSKIHGKGVFANRDFKKGEDVIDYSACSEKLTKEQVKKLSENKKKYVADLGDGKYILFKSPAKYVNHSCDANTNSDGRGDVAIRNIKKGEEIAGDYSRENVPDMKMRCRCGSKNCKRVITGQEIK